jgi:hypothetical protein
MTAVFGYRGAESFQLDRRDGTVKNVPHRRLTPGMQGEPL